jgi:hypothetical protein
LYWGIAAFSTAGIADAPQSGVSQLVGGIWIVLGSILFFRNDCRDRHGLFYASTTTACKAHY